MKKLLCILFLFFNFYFSSFAQLVINNSSLTTGVYVVMNGGTQATPIYLNVNNVTVSAAATADIKLTTDPATSSYKGWIISEGQYNYVKWNNINTTANYRIPFGYSNTVYIPFTFSRTAGAGNIAFSTWGTNEY